VIKKATHVYCPITGSKLPIGNMARIQYRCHRPTTGVSSFTTKPRFVGAFFTLPLRLGLLVADCPVEGLRNSLCQTAPRSLSRVKLVRAARVNALGHPLPCPETGSTEAGHTPFLVREVGGGMSGVDAGSTICGYKIAGIGHRLHMRFGSLSRIGLASY